MYSKKLLSLLISLSLFNYCFALYHTKNENNYHKVIIDPYSQNILKSIPNSSIQRRHNKYTDTSCSIDHDCKENQLCYQGVCIFDSRNQSCDITTQSGEPGNSCTEPFYCENDVCKLPRNNKSQKGINFLFTLGGLLSVLAFFVFLVIVFVVVFNFASKHKEKIEKKIGSQQDNKNTSNIQFPNMLNPSEERNIYLRSLKEKNSSKSVSQEDPLYKRSSVLNQFKTNDPYTTVNSNTKKDFDIAGNTYPKTPQSASTLINKSFSSTNNLIDRNRLSDRSSVLNSFNYRKNSAGAVSSPVEASLYNASFQDFNTSNSYTYLYPSENRNYLPQYNTYTSSVTSPTTIHPSMSMSFSSPRRLSPIESPILPMTMTSSVHDAIASTSTPYILEVEEEDDVDQVEDDDEDNQTTLSFDDGVLKVSSSSSRKHKPSMIYSYTDELNCSNECVIPSPETTR